MFEDFSLFFKKYSEDILIDGEPSKGYWSNLSKEENFELINDLNQNTTKEIIKKKKPILFDMIFSEQRAIGLELLKLKGNENLIDLGCMWGALTIPASKQVKSVLGVDQTMESLIFSNQRAKEENLNNIKFLNADIRKVNLPNIFDVAIINGVLSKNSLLKLRDNGRKKYIRLMIAPVMRVHLLGYMLTERVIGKTRLMLHFHEESTHKEVTTI